LDASLGLNFGGILSEADVEAEQKWIFDHSTNEPLIFSMLEPHPANASMLDGPVDESIYDESSFPANGFTDDVFDDMLWT
jgi:hypothetical protein